jgi:hypothetical protein
MNQIGKLLNNGNYRIENISNRELMWRNFAGEVKPGKKWDKAGEPYFNIELSPEIADELREDGWIVDQWTSKNAEEGTEPIDYIKVTVDVDGFNKSKTWHVGEAGPDGVRHKHLMIPNTPAYMELDNTIFETVDVSIRPWTTKSGKNEGLKKAYLDTMYYVIQKDAFFDKWGSVMDEADFGGADEDFEE